MMALWTLTTSFASSRSRMLGERDCIFSMGMLALAMRPRHQVRAPPTGGRLRIVSFGGSDRYRRNSSWTTFRSWPYDPIRAICFTSTSSWMMGRSRSCRSNVSTSWKRP